MNEQTNVKGNSKKKNVEVEKKTRNASNTQTHTDTHPYKNSRLVYGVLRRSPSIVHGAG